MLSIDFLADKPEFVRELSEGIYEQWIDMYTKQGKNVTDIEKNCIDRSVKDKIPLTMVASLHGKLVGSVTIKNDDLSGYPELNPWVAGVFVLPAYRKQGIGSKLVLHAEKTAKEVFKKDKIYLYTGSASELYKKLGYKQIDTVERPNKVLTVMEKEIG